MESRGCWGGVRREDDEGRGVEGPAFCSGLDERHMRGHCKDRIRFSTSSQDGGTGVLDSQSGLVGPLPGVT